MEDTDRQIEQFSSQLGQVTGLDRRDLQREIRRIKHLSRAATPPQDLLRRMAFLKKRFESALTRRRWRISHRPRPAANPVLPIAAKAREIVAAIARHQVLIISGETGSGKTTQIPKFCLAAGRGIDGKIGCTQPRRIAATSVAHRIAEELGQKIGQSVGYKIRFRDRTPPDAFIKIMTDGILLAEAQADRLFFEYDTIIVDEAHERSLNIDFILGQLKTLLKRRRDLKLIVTSATIDTEKFSKAFDNAPVIEVSGRMYPVEVRYQGPDQAWQSKDDATHVELALAAVEHLRRERRRGDMLVFMPTEQDIRETCDALKERRWADERILPLFARLSSAEQKRVFACGSGRKIIVATNVAETSITIPGIAYVVDTGLARIARYSPRSRTTSLPVIPVSRSSADQRKGRCGRVANGVCVRLYSETDYLSRPLYTPPEILRTNLAEVILRMIALKLGDISVFPFVDPPAPKSIQDGFRLLKELGAIKERRARRVSAREGRFILTRKGRLMAKMPLDPRLSRMLLEAAAEGCLEEMAVIAAALSIQDPRERPLDKKEAADQAHGQFDDPSSDFVALLNLWRAYWEAAGKKKTLGRLKAYCRTHYLSFRRMREWQDIYHQITQVLAESGLRTDRPDAGFRSIKSLAKATAARARPDHDACDEWYAALHRSVLSGFLSNIAVKKDKNIFSAGGGREVMVFPGSGLFNRPGQWIVAAEMVQTSRLFARTAANIDPGWLEALGKGQCRYTYLNPRWEKKREQVVADEQVSLYGLIIVPGRTKAYGPIDPEAANDIFIRRALIEGEVKKPLPFMLRNRQLIEDVETVENKLRRKNILVDENDLFAFYKRRLPGVCDLQSIRHRVRKNGGDGFLIMGKEDLMRYTPDEAEVAAFPDRIDAGGDAFDCSYRFDPGKPEDGVTVSIPATVARTVSAEALDWVVPGLHREKITALVKGLPKKYRKQLVPVPGTVDTICARMPRTPRALITELGDFIYRHFGVSIPASAWPVDQIPEHLRMRIAITGPDGLVIESGRDATILAHARRDQTQPDIPHAVRKRWQKSGLTRWDFDDLAESVVIEDRQKGKWQLFPGLSAGAGAADGVSLRLFQDRNQAVESHVKGVAALLAIHFSKDLKFLKKMLTPPREHAPRTAGFGGPKRFRDDLYQAVFRRLLEKNIRTRSAFDQYAKTVRGKLAPTAKSLLEKSLAVLEAYDQTRATLDKLNARYRGEGPVAGLLAQMGAELTRLVPKNFAGLYSPQRMSNLPRYARAIGIRAQRGVVDLEKDCRKSQKAAFYTEHLDRLLESLSPAVSGEKREAVERFYWMIEDYKISLFAQELKTAGPVSEKRLDQKLREIDRMV